MIQRGDTTEEKKKKKTYDYLPCNLPRVLHQARPASCHKGKLLASSQENKEPHQYQKIKSSKAETLNNIKIRRLNDLVNLLKM